MSWRKPVPRYVPSPPPTPTPPPPSPTAPCTRLSLSLGSAMSDGMPPVRIFAFPPHCLLVFVLMTFVA
jgi:hypothetical protein